MTNKDEDDEEDDEEEDEDEDEDGYQRIENIRG